MGAWQGWFHCTGSTYGAWLRGDPRGWRARHHRENVVGDCKNPPPTGLYDKVLARSVRLMKRERVELDRAQRELACQVMGESLVKDGVEFQDLCVGKKHWHALVRTETYDASRHWMGRAKGRSARALSKAGLVQLGGIWAVRCRPLPIKDRSHKENVTRYIPDHARKGAIVWTIHIMKGKDKPRH